MKVIVDTREKDPWILPDIDVERAALSCGDYTIKGLEHVVRIERKKPTEIWSMVGSCQDRFLDQLNRLSKFPVRLLVIEGTASCIFQRPQRSSVSHDNFCFRLMRWTVERGIPVWFLGARSPDSMRAIVELLYGIQHGYQHRVGFKDSFGMILEHASQFDAKENPCESMKSVNPNAKRGTVVQPTTTTPT